MALLQAKLEQLPMDKETHCCCWRVILHTRFSDDLGGWRTFQELLRPGLFHLPILVALRVMLLEGAFDCGREIEADG